MQREDANFISELEKDLKKDRLIRLLKKYKYIIAAFIVILIIMATSYVLYNSYVTNKANKNSDAFYNIQTMLAKNNNQEAITALDILVKDSTNVYKLLAYLQKINLALRNANYEDALKELKQAQTISLPTVYRDLLQTIELILHFNNPAKSDTKSLLTMIKPALKKESSFYYNNLELYIIALINEQQYLDADKFSNEILQGNNVPAGIKTRITNLKSLITEHL